MTTGLPIAKPAKHRALALLTFLSLTAVLLFAPCRALAAVAPAPHECCQDHCNRDKQETQGCETLCAAKSSNALISTATSVEPARVTGPAVALAPDEHGSARIDASVDPAMTDSSPPLYLKHAALLI